eukprot:2043724-Lingulodinium_polyedra.AAC.1
MPPPCWNSDRVTVSKCTYAPRKSLFWWGARIGLNAREEARNVPQLPPAPESMSRLRRIHARLRLSP